MAFAVGELGLRLEEFWEMAWCEFLIKSYAYGRIQEEKLRHTRLIAYSAQIGSHLDPKKLPKSIEDFMPIDRKKKKTAGASTGVSDDMKELYMKRMAEYKQAKSRQ